MNTKVWYLSLFEGVYHTQTIETFLNVNARMVHTNISRYFSKWHFGENG